MSAYALKDIVNGSTKLWLINWMKAQKLVKDKQGAEPALIDKEFDAQAKTAGLRNLIMLDMLGVAS